jgi:hypothetical protein
MLRRIFGHKKEDVAGGWRKLHNEELYNLWKLSSSLSVVTSKKMRRELFLTLMQITQ